MIYGDTHISLRYGIVVVGLVALGASLARLRVPTRVQANEGMVVVAMMFLVTPLVMAYPMMGFGLNFLDAFFEAVSGVTTTGLSTQVTLVDAPGHVSLQPRLDAMVRGAGHCRVVAGAGDAAGTVGKRPRGERA